MREFISIVEARPKKAQPAPIDPVAQAQGVYDRTVSVAKKVGHALMIRQWSQEWVTPFKALIAKAKQAHSDNEAEEVAYDDTYQPRAFQLDVEEITQQWWQSVVEPQVREMLDAAKHDYERYQDWKPDVESSDQMSLHQSEIALAKRILLHADDSVNGLNTILGALSDFVSSIDLYRDIDYTNLSTRETQDFVERIIPAIMAICRMRGAKPS